MCFPSSVEFLCLAWRNDAVVVVAAAVSLVCIDAVRMRLLWLSIICFVLFMQL